MTRLVKRRIIDPYGAEYDAYLPLEQSASLAAGGALSLAETHGAEVEVEATEVHERLVSDLDALTWPELNGRNPGQQLHDLGYRHPSLSDEDNVRALEHTYDRYRTDRAAFNRTLRANDFLLTAKPVAGVVTAEQDMLREVYHVDPHERLSAETVAQLEIDPATFPGGAPTYADLTDDELLQLSGLYPIEAGPVQLDGLDEDEQLAVIEAVLNGAWETGDRLVVANRLSLNGWRHPEVEWDDQHGNRRALENALVSADTPHDAAIALARDGFRQNGKRSL